MHYFKKYKNYTTTFQFHFLFFSMDKQKTLLKLKYQFITISENGQYIPLKYVIKKF